MQERQLTDQNAPAYGALHDHTREKTRRASVYPEGPGCAG